MINPKVAIIVPVYNIKKYIPDCLESLLNQSYKNFLVYCINDGSDDGSDQVLRAYEIKDKRIKVITTENKGVSFARNKGLQVIENDCKYVCFLDGDDMVSCNYLKMFIEKMVRHNADLAVCGFCEFDTVNIRENKYPKSKREVLDRHELLNSFLFEKNVTSNMFLNNKCFKRDVLENIYFDENLTKAEDHDYFLKVLPLIKKTVLINEINFYYRLRMSSAIHAKSRLEEFQCLVRVYSKAISNSYCTEDKILLKKYLAYAKLELLRWMYLDSKINKEQTTEMKEQLIKDVNILDLYKFKRLHKQIFFHAGYSINYLYYFLSNLNRGRKSSMKRLFE